MDYKVAHETSPKQLSIQSGRNEMGETNYLKVYDEQEFIASEKKREETSTSFNYVYQFPFSCDNFQKHAFQCIENNENVLVTAHTGSGKTAIAEYGIIYWLKKGGRVLYVSPIKSLSNEKFKEITEIIAEVNVKEGTNYTVGILTGDIKLNPLADVIIMTTEILRNALYKINPGPNPNTTETTTTETTEPTKTTEQSSKQVVDFNFTDSITGVIFDEVHYISNQERGTVWEESIIILNSSIQLIMLSATIDNAKEFASWIGRSKQKNINLISTSHRVVPLEHYIYVKEQLFKICSSNEYNPSNFSLAKQRYLKEQEEREKRHQFGVNFTLISDFVTYLKQNDMFQTIVFSFSVANCEKYAHLITFPLVTYEERAEIDQIFNAYMRKYIKQYEHLQQFQAIYSLIQRGVAYHHSGLLPILKEIVEIIFKKGLIKILFATETFAVGVNMPTRTVVFTELEKFTEGGRRTLTPTEYIQMSGRAGRRGKDTIGNVIILPLYQFPSELEFRGIFTGSVQKLKSKFAHNYGFQLKIFLSDSTNIQSFMSDSLFQIDNQKNLSGLQKQFEDLSKKLLDKTSTKEFDQAFIELVTKYDEQETSRLKLEQELGIKVTLSKKQQKEQQKLQFEINKIPDFKKKCELYREFAKEQKNLEEIKKSIYSNQHHTEQTSRQLIQVLIKTGFIYETASEKDPHSIEKDDITVKGILASQINECNPLILTDLIVNDSLINLNPIELITVLSIFIDDTTDRDFEDICVEQLNFAPNKVLDIFKIIEHIADQYLGLEQEAGLYTENYWKLNYGYVFPTFLWANKKPVQEIMQFTNLYEGRFVKNMLKLSNILHDISCLCKIHGSIELLPIILEAEQLIVRDIVTVNSLYCS